MSPTYDDLQVSFGRCLRTKDFIGRFYDVLLQSHPSLAPLFAKTDFRQQRLALRRGISLAISWAAGAGMARAPMDEMIRVHGRGGRAPIPPEFYAYWLESLLTVIRDSDPEVTPMLEQRWRDAMGKVIDAFTRGY
ncbi:hemoglobin-like flavoprotein [Luteibacter sp. Sphag1AF]|uniref:globin n=1 Tax=Luteibacter sp. Sphag1AF TaxID=2587031 RepID=UPI001616E19E|nr:globin [Luteibacter sp. Sphag1AF]MBB3227092.1 hemoglobin-like flavoprotein [Luteibacter sp. Sphag1AF]